jgi:hypothetical protein
LRPLHKCSREKTTKKQKMFICDQPSRNKVDIKVISDLLSLVGRAMFVKSGGFTPQTVVLVIGVDSAVLANQRSVLQSAGYFVTFAESISEAIAHFRDGDFRSGPSGGFHLCRKQRASDVLDSGIRFANSSGLHHGLFRRSSPHCGMELCSRMGGISMPTIQLIQSEIRRGFQADGLVADFTEAEVQNNEKRAALEFPDAEPW